MTKKEPRGSTLILITACVIVIVLLGVALFMLSKIIGGEREVSNATDAGTLNVAKQALRRPCIALNMRPDFQKIMSQHLDSRGQGVDLLVFNRMIAQALLVAMNAAADGNKAAIDNAVNLILELEGSTVPPGCPAGKSVASQLAEALENPEAQDAWAKKAFFDTGAANSLKMVNEQNALVWKGQNFKTGYLEQADSDSGAANVTIDKLLSNMPYTDCEQGTKLPEPENVKASTGVGGPTYLRGYKPIKIKNFPKPIYGVPTQPGQQPHLVSMNTFNKYAKGAGSVPGVDAGIIVPPNAFLMKAGAVDAATGQESTSLAAAIIGVPPSDTLTQAFIPYIPNGYLVVDNTNSSTFTSSPFNGDNVFANELGFGIFVDRASTAFSVGGEYKGLPYNPVLSWEQTPRSEKFDPESGPPVLDDAGNPMLFDSAGMPIRTKAEAAAKIPYAGDSANPWIKCDDQNSSSGTALSDPTCEKLATAGPNGLSPFDTAYHPGPTTLGWAVEMGS